MALLFIDGFDHYIEADVLSKWTAASSPDLQTNGRWGGSCMDLVWDRYAEISLPVRQRLYIGGALWPTGLAGTPGYSYPVLRLYDEDNTTQIWCGANGTLYMEVYRGTASTLLGTASAPLLVNNWVYFECMVHIHDSLGMIVMRINEQTVLNLTGIDTRVGSKFIKRVRIGGGLASSQSHLRWDDFYIDDAQFHGNVRVRTFMPDSDSATHTDFDRSGGSNDYEMVDDATPDDDSTYIYSTTKGHKSTFGITTGAFPDVVKGAQLMNLCRISTPGIRRMKALVRSGGADYNGPVSGVITSDYRYRGRHVFETDPQDGQPWNQTKLEAAEFGLGIVHGTTSTSTTTTSTTTTV